MGVKKERIESLDFVRVICTLGIILNHFAIGSEASSLIKYFYNYPNGYGSFGYTLVTVFFALSGVVLYHSNNIDESYISFYIKRWKSIFPAYYITFLIVITSYLFTNQSFFESKKAYSLFYTFIGMDGYFSCAFSTWAVIGEWFTGAIVICYLLYPFFARFLNKNEVLTVIILIGLYVMTLDFHMLNQNSFRNVFSCVLSFVIGMVICRHKLFEKNSGFIVGAILVSEFTLSAFVPLQQDANIASHVQGFILLFILELLGKPIMKSKKLSKIISWIAAFSFEIFLIHHVIVFDVLEVLHPNNVWSLSLAFVLCVLISVACGFVINKTKSFIMKWIDVIVASKV